jgi:hypothetical protein
VKQILENATDLRADPGAGIAGVGLAVVGHVSLRGAGWGESSSAGAEPVGHVLRRADAVRDTGPRGAACSPTPLLPCVCRLAQCLGPMLVGVSLGAGPARRPRRCAWPRLSTTERGPSGVSGIPSTAITHQAAEQYVPPRPGCPAWRVARATYGKVFRLTPACLQLCWVITGDSCGILQTDPRRRLVQEIEKSIDAGLYYAALITSVTILDVCSALESADGKASPVCHWMTALLSLAGATSADREQRGTASRLTTTEGARSTAMRWVMPPQGRAAPVPEGACSFRL